MKRLIGLVLVLISINLLAENVLNTKIRDVTVYQSQAEVKRRGSSEFTKGVHEIEVKNLPKSLINSNARAEVLTNSAKILGFKVENAYIEDLEPDAVIKDYQTTIDSITNKVNQLQDQLAILLKTEKFVQEVADNSTKRMTVENSSFTFTDIEKALAFAKKNFRSIKLEQREINSEIKIYSDLIRDLQKKIRFANQVAQSEYTKSMIITFEVFKAQEVNFQVSYNIPNANWQPSYDIFVSEDEKQVALKFSAVVNQQSEEDWNDVNLIISTNDPSIDSNIPVFYPRYLQSAISRAKKLSRGLVAGSASPVSLDSIENESLAEYGHSGFSNTVRREEFQDDMNIEFLSVAEIGSNKNYILKQPVSVKSGFHNQEVMVTTEILDVSTVHYLIPRIAQKAYIRATMENNSELTFLPGKADLFYANTFVATVSLPQFLPKQEIEFSLGTDENIEVKFEKIKDEQGSGFIKKNVSVLNYRITISNFRSEKNDFIVLEQAPLSQNKKIDISILEPNTQFEERSDEDVRLGKLIWRFSLDPEEEKIIEIGYKIKQD